jgi:hypothetical protein
VSGGVGEPRELRVLMSVEGSVVGVSPDLHQDAMRWIPQGSGEPPFIRTLLPGSSEDSTIRSIVQSEGMARTALRSAEDRDTPPASGLIDWLNAASSGTEPVCVFVTPDEAEDFVRSVVTGWDDLEQPVYVVEWTEE